MFSTAPFNEMRDFHGIAEKPKVEMETLRFGDFETTVDFSGLRPEYQAQLVSKGIDEMIPVQQAAYELMLDDKEVIIQ